MIGVESRTRINTDQLIRNAEATGLPFEASPTGRWVRFGCAEGWVYVIGDAWGDGCSVLVTDQEGNRRVQHCHRQGDGISLAARLVRHINSKKAQQRVPAPGLAQVTSIDSARLLSKTG